MPDNTLVWLGASRSEATTDKPQLEFHSIGNTNENFFARIFDRVSRRDDRVAGVRSLRLLHAPVEHDARDELLAFTMGKRMVWSGWRAIHSLWDLAAGRRGSSESNWSVLEQLHHSDRCWLSDQQPVRVADQFAAHLSRI